MMKMETISNASFNSLEMVKKDPLAVAILIDIAYFSNRKVSELVSDLNLTEESMSILQKLERERFIRPNPHHNVPDIKYILAEKGYFLLNELKMENPDLLKEVEPRLIQISRA